MLIMDEKYTSTIINSTLQMVYDLQYLGRNDLKTLKTLTILKVVNSIYQWAEWYHIAEEYRIKIEKVINIAILHNSNITLPEIAAGVNYSNVNIPVNTKVWQRVYDDTNSTTWELDEP